MNKYSIWIINQYIDTPPDFFAHRHYCLSKSFAENGHKVTLINGSFSHLKANKTNVTNSWFDFSKIEENITLVTVKIPSYKSSKTIGRLWNMIVFCLRLFFLPTSKMDSPDIIIVSSTSLFPVLNGIFLKRKFKGSKFIFEIRDIWPLTLIELDNVSKTHPFVFLLSIIERLGYRNADWVTSTIKHADEHIQTTIHKKINFTWVGNGILPETYKSTNLLNRVLPYQKFNITYAGSLGIANALQYFVNAARLLKDNFSIHFNIVGDGALKKELESLAVGLENITFYGKVNFDVVQQFYNESDALYIEIPKKNIYRFGISPNKLHEYLLSGKPIIMSGSHVKSNQVALANAGIVVDSESAELIANAITELKNLSAEERKKLGANGKKYVLENNNYKFLAQKYIDIFNQLF